MFRTLLFNGFTENSHVSGKDSENQKSIYLSEITCNILLLEKVP